MASHVAVGPWAEQLSAGSFNVTIEPHQQYDHGTMLVASLATGTAAPSGWTQVGIEYVENLIFWRVFEIVFPTTEAADTVVSISPNGGGTAVIDINRDFQLGGTLVFQDDNTSDAFGVVPTINGNGYFVEFTPIYATRTTYTAGDKISLASGTVTSETSEERAFLTGFSGAYRVAVATIEVVGGVSAVFTQRWAGGNATSNGIRVQLNPLSAPQSLVPTPTEVISGSSSDIGLTGGLASRTDVVSATPSPAPTSIQKLVPTASAVAAGSSTRLQRAGGVVPDFDEQWTLETAPTVSTATSATLGTTQVPITDSKIVLTGYASGSDGIVAVDSGYYRAPFVSDIGGAGTSTNPRMMPFWGPRIKALNLTAMELQVRTRVDMGSGGNTVLRIPINIKVNGKWTSMTNKYILSDGSWGMTALPPTFSSGSVRHIKMTFPSAADRVIQIDCMLEILGVRVDSGATVVQAPPVEKTYLVISESSGAALNHGTGDNNNALTSIDGDDAYATYTNVFSWITYEAQSLGYDNIVNLASSGSGYGRNGDTINYSATGRLTDASKFPYDLAQVGTAGNDANNGVSNATINANSDTVLAALKAARPSALVVSAGMGITTPGDFKDADDTVKLSSSDNGVWYYAAGAADIKDPTGATYSTTLPPMDVSAHTSSDGMHQSQYGSQLSGQQMSEFLRLILEEEGAAAIPLVPGSTDAVSGSSSVITAKRGLVPTQTDAVAAVPSASPKVKLAGLPAQADVVSATPAVSPKVIINGLPAQSDAVSGSSTSLSTSGGVASRTDAVADTPSASPKLLAKPGVSQTDAVSVTPSASPKALIKGLPATAAAVSGTPSTSPKLLARIDSRVDVVSTTPSTSPSQQVGLRSQTDLTSTTPAVSPKAIIGGLTSRTDVVSGLGTTISLRQRIQPLTTDVVSGYGASFHSPDEEIPAPLSLSVSAPRYSLHAAVTEEG